MQGPAQTEHIDMDRAYANGDFIPGAAEYPPRWDAKARAFRDSLGARFRDGLAYGPGIRQQLDLCLPETSPRGVLVFVHGGYWLRFGRESWTHLAAGALARGWAVALPSYTLAPAATLPEIALEIGLAVEAALALVEGPAVLAGHSAGGQLVARMASATSPLGAAARARLARVVPISPVSELSPLLQTTMNASLRLTPETCATESPARLSPLAHVAAHVWVGGQERPSFLWQARLLSEEWACPWTVDPGRHHFDVIDALADPASPLVATCFEGL